jgi:CYTH domain-containing protein
VTGELIREHASELRDLLSQIESAHDEKEAHAARIAAKRLRYLLEPLGKSVAGVKPQIKELKRLQDILGELNDAHVMSVEIAAAIEVVAAEQARRLHRLALETRTTDEIAEAESPLPGLLALTRLCGERRDRLFQALNHHWLNDSAIGFFARVSGLADDLIGQAEPHTEIERKYLLTGLPDHVRQGPSILIDQGWILGDQIQERLRRVRSPDGVRFYRTVKSGSGLVRVQLEERVSRRVFQQLWRLTDGRRLRKRRYVVAEKELTWEIDEFLDRDLVLAEVELPSADFEVTLPEWLQPLVGREVTGRSEYENVKLARKTPVNRRVKKRRRS